MLIGIVNILVYRDLEDPVQSFAFSSCLIVKKWHIWPPALYTDKIAVQLHQLMCRARLGGGGNNTFIHMKEMSFVLWCAM